ncbi:hypothetical protein M0R45_001377 [Rubus argutus]|uniref:Uncharacterized protein n=1 Tax=Rubus argutus TaxID=59490 RepID=A0AAW1VHN7_RUBAR
MNFSHHHQLPKLLQYPIWPPAQTPPLLFTEPNPSPSIITDAVTSTVPVASVLCPDRTSARPLVGVPPANPCLAGHHLPYQPPALKPHQKAVASHRCPSR